MNIKKFRIICKVSSILLTMSAIVIALIVFSSLYTYFFTDTDIWFNLSTPSFTFFNSGRGFPDEADFRLAALIDLPFTFFLSIYIFWKVSQLFKYLSEGHSPFSFQFAQSIKRLGIIMIFSDILLPLFRSLLVSILMQEGYYILFGVGSSLMIGLILCAVSETFNYGIELQTLSDETV